MVIVDRLYTKTGDGRSVWVGTSYIDGNTWILHTDYGTASYHWGSPGTKTLKEFLAAEPNGRVDTNYLLRKLWQEPLKLKEIDWDATRKNLWDGFKESLYDEKYRGKEPLDWERARERYEHLRAPKRPRTSPSESRPRWSNGEDTIGFPRTASSLKT